MASSQASQVVNLGVQQAEQLRSKSLFQKALYRILHDRMTMVALVVLGIMTTLTLLAAPISNHVLKVDPFRTDPYYLRNGLKYLPINSEVVNPETGTVTHHWLGTDEQGRDHLARLLYGGQVSLRIAFFSAVLSLIIGITIGVVTGYYGGILDDIVIWFITTLNSVPQLFLLLMLSAVLLRAEGSWFAENFSSANALIIVLAFLGWTGATRLVRGETFSLKQREFVVAARAIGASDFRIMFIHIVPNIISLLVISLALSIGALILAESALSFLDFGVKPPEASWGNMLTTGLEMIRLAPHLVILPGLMISITVLCLYIIGDGVRDAFDPTLVD